MDCTDVYYSVNFRNKDFVYKNNYSSVQSFDESEIYSKYMQ